MAGNFGLLWLFVALFFVFMCYVWWYLSIIEKTSTSILVFFVLAMTASMFALVLSGLNHIAQNIQPFIQVKSIVSPIDHCGIIGQNPQISSIPSFDPLSDSRHAMVCTHDSRWTIQNLSFHRNLIILRNNITLNPHELPLTKGDSFSINNHKFLISDNFQMPGSMFAKLSVQLPDGKCLNAYRWKTFLISTQGSLRSDAPVIPGQPGQHLAKIYYHSGLHQFVLTWFSSDKSRVQISYNGLNLLNRSINIFNNDTMIIGRTSYQLTISPKNILELHPVKKTYQIPLPETESFIFASTLNMWDSSVQIVLPLQLTEPIHVKSVKNEFNHTLIVNSKNGRNKTLSSGNVFSVRDQYDNLITFSFAGQFFPNSFFNWFINPSPAFQNHTRHIIYVFFFMLILICRLIVSKQLNYWSLPVFMGTLLLTSIGVVFMFRLDVSCRQYANIAIDHIWFIYISLTVLFLTSFSGSLIRKKRKFNLKKAYKKNFQSAFRKEFEHIERDEWTWPIYDSMIEGNWINKPAIVLFFFMDYFFVSVDCRKRNWLSNIWHQFSTRISCYCYVRFCTGFWDKF
ncbi:membrane protein [Candidatus Magnetomorum sp. HK-1]|nr:membrane protein [Candidatus Magnetomorum sp. HK-1]